MDIVMKASTDANTCGDISSSNIGLTSSVLPEAKTPDLGERSRTGVSTNSAYKRTEHWYALRTTYGRERKAHDFINAHAGRAFLPTITTEKVINGKKKLVEVSRLPNIFFAYGAEEDIKSFVYDNYNLPYLRFYYKHTHAGAKIEKTPLIVPDNQIRSLQIICNYESHKDVIITDKEIIKFREGEKVRIIKGDFEGVEGIVARFHGQQRVGVVIGNILTAVTAYIPTAFITHLNKD